MEVAVCKEIFAERIARNLAKRSVCEVYNARVFKRPFLTQVGLKVIC